MTMHGKSRTMPSGIDTDELPLRRIRRRKKPNRGDSLSARRVMSSSFGKLAGDDGMRFARFCISPMGAAKAGGRWCVGQEAGAGDKVVAEVRRQRDAEDYAADSRRQ